MRTVELLKNYFSSQSIEYFASLSYKDCREINTGIRERAGFMPRSVILFLVPYYFGECENMSRYCASLDYHIAIKEISSGLIEMLKSEFPEAHFCSYGDHSPIDECHAALIAGLGVRGDNGLLINEKYGSYIFIGDTVTDISPEVLGAVTPVTPGECLHCGACRRACPTKILSGEGSDCLSAITQRKGELSENEVALMRKLNTVWGCDECQACCPYNKSPILTPVSFFQRDRIECLTSEILSGLDKENFKKRAFAWRGRKTGERNLKYLGY